MNDPHDDSLDSRVRAALSARAALVTERNLTDRPTPAAPARRRPAVWIAPLVAAAAVVAIAVSVAVAGHSGGPSVAGPGTSVSTGSRPSGSRTPSPSETSSSGGLACIFADISACRVPYPFVWQQPLWPFANANQVRQWRADSGSQPWHLDASLTAAYFVRDYLHFTDVNIVTSSTFISADEAHIGVGFRDPNGAPHTAAVIHLYRYERVPGDTGAPWEVVGATSSGFSITTPKYGAVVGGERLVPLKLDVGGRITGVDESIQVQGLTPGSRGPVACCVAAGGQNSPWTTVLNVPLKLAPLAIVAWTGGHLQAHERFVVQGVHEY